MPTLVHFEIPSDDIDRSKKFYNELFGWTIEKLPEESLPEGMEYFIISTVDGKGNKALSWGMMKRQNAQQQGITNYIDVKSVDEYSTKVEQLGGKVMIPKNLFREWVILLYVQLQKIIVLGFGKLMPMQNKVTAE
jgi:uncharacterized protein